MKRSSVPMLITMVITTLFLIVIYLVQFSVNPSKMDDNYAEKFASSVNCAIGYKGACFCFVASRQTGYASSTGIGMAIDHTGNLCK